MRSRIIPRKQASQLLQAAIAGSVLCINAVAAQAQEGGDTADSRVLEEVVVTAQRRVENIQSVPVAIPRPSTAIPCASRTSAAPST